jgi:hypothetical protein
MSQVQSVLLCRLILRDAAFVGCRSVAADGGLNMVS